MNARRLAPLMLVLVAGCQAPEPEAPVSTRVENPTLRVAVADLPAPFVVAENSGSALRFTTTHQTGGEVTVTVGEPEYGLNLPAKARAKGEDFRAQPGGEYFGSRELGTPFGPAYYARGSFDGAGGRIEELWIFALHPAGDSSLLTLTYSYPPGEEQVRVPELLPLIGEFEAFEAFEAESSAPPEDGS